MSIYTKTGDKGTTALFDGSRVKKYDDRVETYGSFDELNAEISVAEKFVTSAENKTLLRNIERQLFYLCAELATENEAALNDKIIITQDDISNLEKIIDNYSTKLPKVDSFVLPGSSTAGAFLHSARTIARRAERLLVRFAEQTPVRMEILKYVNRLSDCLYILAREEDFRQMLDKATKLIVERYLKQTEKEPSKTTELSFSFCEKLMRHVCAISEEESVPVTLAVVDAHGNTRFNYRMEQALLVSAELATKKAYSAVAMKTSTENLAEAVQPGAELYQLETLTNGDIVTFGGGVPIYTSNGTIIGGIGISGGSVEQDIRIAKKALSMIEKG
ncbi:cob(I)yrinic acid a,c-diamide adenosyltransferase [Listeria sp. FSL L7-1485]|uniref:Corrinoid adenosyltransferase n=1 Tax=Listeria immobilis TaxID=2713502 RepID=A0A7X1C9X8_9LIST|nr:cob(I)yrinic acid a,c-diamide adenosyltransferase [Listeria immobilis]MBC1489798.1 cob(I)yrinic acid a,c-diamide adenosyltransferase [Listeria immobilis]MBC1536776.1 cob(I)yrinic acid a,c-diamide adenosyltransferase [Listeria immobilis]